MKFRKKPVVIDAIQYTGSEKNFADVLAFFPNSRILKFCPKTGGVAECLLIKTSKGTLKANHGDWIIKGVKGEFYPIKADIFQLTYEEV